MIFWDCGLSDINLLLDNLTLPLLTNFLRTYLFSNVYSDSGLGTLGKFLFLSSNVQRLMSDV